MTSAPVYQIAFMFVFNQDFTSQKVQIDVADSNSFVVSNTQTAQLEAYSGSVTPPLLNFSVSGQKLFFNISEGTTYGGMQALVWSSFTVGSPSTLQLDAQFPSGLITATYNVLGVTASGQLVSGRNTIQIGH